MFHSLDILILIMNIGFFAEKDKDYSKQVRLLRGTTVVTRFYKYSFIS